MVDAGAADGRKARASAGRTAFHGTRGGHQGMVNILEVHKLHGTWESFQGGSCQKSLNPL